MITRYVRGNARQSVKKWGKDSLFFDQHTLSKIAPYSVRSLVELPSQRTVKVFLPWT